MGLHKRFGFITAILFALITLAIYFPVLAGKVPFPRDMILQFPAWDGRVHPDAWQHYADIGDLVTAFYPARDFAARALQRGTLPLWNPYFLSGAPFLANPQSSLFYPPNFLYAIFAVPTAWTLCLMLRLFLSGIFMTLFLRSIGASQAGSIFAGIVFALSGFMTAWQGQPMDDAAMWLPFVCYAVIRLAEQSSRFSVVLAAFGFAMPVLAGHPETAAHVTFVALLMAGFVWMTSRFNARFLLQFTAAGILAIGLASVQIIPTLEWLSQMPSPLELRWPPLTAHDFLTWVSRDIMRAPNSARLWMPETAAYAGMMTLLLAPIGLLHRNRRYAIFLSCVTIFAAGTAFGIAPMKWIVDHIPVLSGLKNARMVFITNFGLAALAGLGVTTLEENAPFKPNRRALILAFVTTAFLAAFVLAYKLQLETTFRVEFLRRPSFSRALLLAGLIPILWQLYSRRPGRLFPVVACALAGFDLLTFAYGFTGFTSRDEIYPQPSVFSFIAKQSGAPFRIATIGQPFPLNVNMVYGISSADGYEVRLIPTQLAFTSDYSDKTFPGIFLKHDQLLALNDRRLDMLNVKYFAVTARAPEFQLLKASQRFSLAYNNGYVALFENRSALPRAFAVPSAGIQVVSEEDRQLDALKNPAFDPSRNVIVSNPPASLDRSSGDFNGTVTVTETGINDLSIHAITSAPAVLVVSQTYYPGWTATIDGKATEIFRANLNLTGVGLPAGAHDVRLAFRPFSVKIGGALSIAAAVILSVLAITHKSSSGPRNSEIQQITNTT